MFSSSPTPYRHLSNRISVSSPISSISSFLNQSLVSPLSLALLPPPPHSHAPPHSKIPSMIQRHPIENPRTIEPNPYPAHQPRPAISTSTSSLQLNHRHLNLSLTHSTTRSQLSKPHTTSTQPPQLNQSNTNLTNPSLTQQAPLLAYCGIEVSTVQCAQTVPFCCTDKNRSLYKQTNNFRETLSPITYIFRR